MSGSRLAAAPSGARTTAATGPWAALLLLTAIFILANIDRNILAILLPAIQRDFALADWQLGLLGGFAFSLVYGIAGLVVSHHADRGDRAKIVALSLAFWSAMTALCGAAGSFVALLAARAGVGLGEAGCSPPAHSLIADLFPPARRALALGIYAAGASIGLTASYLLGAWLSQTAGWRMAFVIVGVPGLLLTPLVLAFLRDRRPPSAHDGASATRWWPAFRANLGTVWRVRALRHVFLAASLAAGVSASSILFVPTYLIRTHGLTATQVGLALGLLTGIIGSTGTIAGGWLADRLARRDPRRSLWVAAAAKLIALPGLFFFFLAGDANTALLVYVLPSLVGGIWLGPTYAFVQTQSAPGVRATNAALLLLTFNLIGFGLMPLLIGAASDVLRASVGANGLSFAMLLLVPFSFWAALHYMLASRCVVAPPADQEHGL